MSELRHIDSLIPYARNSKKHPPQQVAQLAASISEWGMAGVIVVRNGVIAKGHGTLAAIRQLWDAGHVVTLPPDSEGHREPLPDRTAPVIDASGWSEAQFKAFVIADNRLGESEWDMDILKIELEDLDGLGFDLDLTGFDLGELEGLMVGEAEGGDGEQKEETGIDYKEKFSVLIECADEPEQQQIYEKLSGMGYSCKVLVN